MGSKYFGEAKIGNERGTASSSSSSSSSSRKGKKSNISDKPKQPQRGLGVAQLEKIRLHSQLSTCDYLPSIHNPYASNFSQEDLTLQTPYSSSSSSFSYSSSSSLSYGFQGPHGIMMGFPGSDRANIKYGDSQPSSTVASWRSGNEGFENQHFVQPNMSMTRSFFEPGVESTLHNKNNKESKDWMGSNSENSESTDSQDIDLELRLSL